MVVRTVSRSTVEIHRLADLAERLQLADRLRKLTRARLHILEQSHILDRNHRLVGERQTNSICLSVNG